MKSVSTFSIELIDATETRSAGAIFSLTYFVAPSTARCTSSGCIELTSNNNTIRRRPASWPEDIGVGVGSGACGWALRLRAPSGQARLRVAEQRDRSRRAGPVVDLLEREAPDRLRLAVLEHLEIGLGEAANDRARVVADHHVHRDERMCSRETRSRRRRLLRAAMPPTADM